MPIGYIMQYTVHDNTAPNNVWAIPSDILGPLLAVACSDRVPPHIVAGACRSLSGLAAPGPRVSPWTVAPRC